VIEPQALLFILLMPLLALNLVVMAARSSLDNMNLARLLTQRDERPAEVDRALQVLNNARTYTARLHLLQVILHLLLGAGFFAWLATAGEAHPAIALWPALGLCLLAAVLLAWLEWLIYERGAITPETWGIRLAGFTRAVGFVAAPLAALPLAVSQEAGGVMESATRVTEAELKTMVDASQQDGVLEQDERQMIYSIFELGDTLAREIMVPRIDVLALEIGTPLQRAIDSLLASGYSRVPVYQETIDNILGLLYAKDLLNVWHSGDRQGSLGDLLRPAYFIPEAKKVDELLTEMQARRIHMAIVVDEYGGVAGLVTLEDIVEEIVGEIHDEYDKGEEAFYIKVGEDEYICAGRMLLDDFNELLGVRLPDTEADTLGGYIYSRIGRVPIGGESLQVDDLRLTVEQVSKRRIRKVRAARVPYLEIEPKEAPDDRP
jgi:CBS domain containing-hemolysin-like protein